MATKVKKLIAAETFEPGNLELAKEAEQAAYQILDIEKQAREANKLCDDMKGKWKPYFQGLLEYNKAWAEHCEYRMAPDLKVYTQRQAWSVFDKAGLQAELVQSGLMSVEQATALIEKHTMNESKLIVKFGR